MFYLAIMCISMAIISAVFWVIEIRPVFIKAKTVQKGFFYPFKLVILLFTTGIAFIIDLVATVSLTMIFGLGGLIGTTMALSISNVLSIALLINFKPWEKA